MHNTKYNLQALFFAVLYAAFAGVTLRMILSGRYLNYLTPKSLKYLIFLAVIFALFAVSELTRLKRPGNFRTVLSSMILLIPLGLMVQPTMETDINALGTGYMGANLVPDSAKKTTGYQGSTYQGESMTFTIKDATAPDLNTANSSNSFFEKRELTGLDKNAKTLTISDDEFYDWITRIFADPSQYLGYTVTVNGKVFHDDKYMSQNQFVPSRLLMTCCVADTVPCGLIADYDKVSTLTPGSWVKVTGKLKMGKYNGQDGPVIDVTSVGEGTKPENEYVYAR